MCMIRGNSWSPWPSTTARYCDMATPRKNGSPKLQSNIYSQLCQWIWNLCISHPDRPNGEWCHCDFLVLLHWNHIEDTQHDEQIFEEGLGVVEKGTDKCCPPNQWLNLYVNEILLRATMLESAGKWEWKSKIHYPNLWQHQPKNDQQGSIGQILTVRNATLFIHKGFQWKSSHGTGTGF